MTVKNNQPNPLNIFDLREVKQCPPHFYAVDFDLSTNEKKITDWIYENLTGRFFLGDYYGREIGSSRSGSFLRKRAAFEIHSEASYFAMFLPDLNKF